MYAEQVHREGRIAQGPDIPGARTWGLDALRALARPSHHVLMPGVPAPRATGPTFQDRRNAMTTALANILDLTLSNRQRMALLFLLSFLAMC
jgi:hypothetical protein